MKILIATDSFKGSMSSIQAGKAIQAGIETAYNIDEECGMDKNNPDLEIVPLADGGEGTVVALVEGMGGVLEKVLVTGPLQQKVEAVYGIVDNLSEKTDQVEKTAVIEIAEVAGITLVPNEQRNPMKTTTFGVGELIKDAISKGCYNFIIGIGGSATNDGGVGMLQALGFDFKDKNGYQVALGAEGLANIEKISNENVLKELKKCTFKIACDVTNPLCGELGCSKIFAPQKFDDVTRNKFSKEMDLQIEKMDRWLRRYGELAKLQYPNGDINRKGAGAAGGLGFAFATFLDGKLQPGIDIIIEESGLEGKIKTSDLVITGEGCLDGQTAMGKAPIGVAKIAKKYGKKVIAFSGAVTEEARACNQAGIDAFFPVIRQVTSLEEAMKTDNARNNLQNTVEQVFRLIRTFQ